MFKGIHISVGIWEWRFWGYVYIIETYTRSILVELSALSTAFCVDQLEDSKFSLGKAPSPPACELLKIDLFKIPPSPLPLGNTASRYPTDVQFFFRMNSSFTHDVVEFNKVTF